jgi:predicted dehydrogenase
MNRRRFLKTSTAIGLASFAAPFVHAQDKAGRKYKTALVGCGWWGGNILGEAMRSERCQIVGICDVDKRHLAQKHEQVQKGTGDTPRHYNDYRELLEKEKPEIVINATPDHWHPLITIDAVKAAAHVYVEKPIGHTIKEGRAMVNAARAADRVVQVGTHRRVSPHNVSGREFIRSGKAGKIGMIRAFVHYGGGPESPQANEQPPKELDWEMWCGPGPLRPFNRRIHPKGFRQFLDYANGTLGDWGIHWMDQILWIMEAKYPKRVFTTGGRDIKGPPVNTPEAQTTDAPDHQITVFDFDGFSVSWEHRQFAGNNAEKGENVGCYFYGTNGTFHQGWHEGWTFYATDAKKEPLHEKPTLHEPDQQNIRELWTDLLACIENKRRPVSDIEEIHRSTNMALLGMLSLKLGRAIQWDGEREECLNDPQANSMLRREYRAPWKYPES